MKYNLPKGYLSYSSWSLWKKDKNAFRRRYYLNEGGFENVETIFGKKIARLLEDEDAIKKHPILSQVPRYPISEHCIEIEVAGIPIKGYLDTFKLETLSFMEFKSGHRNLKKEPPWNKVKVSKHDQLPFYSFLIQQKYGKVDRVTHLHWIETRFKEKEIMFQGIRLISDSRELELTGNIESFKRVIPQWERDYIKNDIIKVAKEISEDYEDYEKYQKSIEGNK